MQTLGVHHVVKEFSEQLKKGQLLELLFDAVPDVYFFAKNQKGQFVGANTGFVMMMGGDSIESIIGKTDYDLVPDFLARNFQEGDKLVLDSKQPMYNEIELVPSIEGALAWHCTSKVPLFDENDKVTGIAGVTRLIDDRDAVYMNHPEMRQIVKYLRQYFKKKISMGDAANAAGVSVSKQERLFKKIFGITPLMYLQKIRLNAACDLLRNTKQDLAKIAVSTGFNDQTSMTRAFRLELKITPLKYRKNYTNIK